MPVPVLLCGRSKASAFRISGASGLWYYPVASRGYFSSMASSAMWASSASGEKTISLAWKEH